jgi:lipopolysaccharide biosynthesis regulator YciM
MLEISYDLLWLLLPVAAASGWMAARRSYAGRPPTRRPPIRLSPDYFKGINYLLNEQPDKAIEVFIKMLEVDTETVETHFALGNLFRRRGEVDRAIRIHQNLVARANLTHEERTLAVLELGIDYMRSGLLDRAEVLFQQLIEKGSHVRPALKQLVDIYQQEQDWNKAIEYARRLEKASGKRLQSMISHFICEQAEECCRNRDYDRAQAYIGRALAEDPDCVRANLMAGHISMETGHYEDAIDRFQRIGGQDAEFLSETIQPQLQCHRHLDRVPEFISYLSRLADDHTGITPVLTLTELIAERDGTQAAIDYLSASLHKRPTVRGLDRLVQFVLATADERGRDHLLLLKEFTAKLLEDRAIYRCSQCGFTGKLLHWQCPGCKAWNTVKPIHGIQGE